MGTTEHCPKIQPQEYKQPPHYPFRRFPSTHRLKIESTSCQIEMPMTQVDFRNLSKSRPDGDNRTLSEDSTSRIQTATTLSFPTLQFAISFVSKVLKQKLLRHRPEIKSTSCQMEMPMTPVDFRNLSKSRLDGDNRTLSEDSTSRVHHPFRRFTRHSFHLKSF